MNEDYFPLFLDKLKCRDELLSLTLSNVPLSSNSLRALIQRAKVLKELALINIKFLETPLEDFLLDFGEEPTCIQHLSLIKMNLNGSHLTLLKTIITANHKLENLNLSSNSFTPNTIY